MRKIREKTGEGRGESCLRLFCAGRQRKRRFCRVQKDRGVRFRRSAEGAARNCLLSSGGMRGGREEQCARAKSTAGEEGRFLASSLREGKKRESGRSCVRADRRAVQRRAERSGGSRGKVLSVHGQTREEMRTDAQTAGAFSEQSCFPILSGGQKATKKAQQCCAFLGTGHPATTVTVASFRTWRGWRRDRRPVP